MMFDPNDRANEPTSETIDNVSDDTQRKQISESPRIKRIKRKRNKAIRLQIQLLSLLLVVVFVIGLLIPLRPKVSDLENRTLTKFPKITWSGMLDGSFFSAVELWYADTFPMREMLINLDGRFESLFGINEEQMIGAPASDDEIPVVTTKEGGFDWMQLPVPISTSEQQVTTDAPVTSYVSPEQTDLQVPSETDAPESDPFEFEPPTDYKDPTVVPEKHGAIYLVGDTAYELYGFNRDATDDYIDMVNNLSEKLEGKATVYPIIAPLSYSVNLSEAYQEKIGLTNQNDALVYIYSRLNDNVKKVYTYANLVAHKDEYLYFRTDHHWTALGAYYAYEVFCAQKGIAPNPLSAYTTYSFDGFLGTLYGSSGSPLSMHDNPDTVVAYQPISTNSMTCYPSSGDPFKWNIITNVSKWKPGVKYNTFIGGDNPYSEIHNPSKTDGSACVVVKNSYGNAFVPFLVDHYEYVYVVDFRYYDKWSDTYNSGLTFTDLINEKHIQDVLIVTNILATGSESQIGYMSNMFNK